MFALVCFQSIHEDVRAHHEPVMLAVHNANFLLETQSDKLSNSSKDALKTYSEDLKVEYVPSFCSNRLII